MFPRSSIRGLHFSARPGTRLAALLTSKSGRFPPGPLSAKRVRDGDGLVAPKLVQPAVGPAAPKLVQSAGGFTLLEILVVLALFGLISALMIGSGGALLRASAQEDVGTAALGAIAAARHQAVLSGTTVELRVDDKARVLDWGAGRAPLTGEDRVKLLPPVRASAMLIGGRLEEESIPRVRFYADGTCDPFRVEILRPETREVLVIDPWTCTVLAPDAASRTR